MATVGFKGLITLAVWHWMGWINMCLCRLFQRRPVWRGRSVDEVMRSCWSCVRMLADRPSVCAACVNGLPVACTMTSDQLLV